MPAPLVIGPSQAFLGNDGNWSAFAIAAGSPPQQLNLLPATSGSAVWAVDTTLGCAGGPPLSNSSSCMQSRGGTFGRARSSSWVGLKYANSDYSFLAYLPVENSTLHIPTLNALAYGGLDKLQMGLGSGSPTLDGQYIGSYFARSFVPWVGALGLSWYDYPSGDPSFPSVSPPLKSLRNQSIIPSQSYGYTAGAAYKNPPQYGSLLLGGYDSSRGDLSNALQVALGGNLQDLVLNIRDLSIGSDSALGINQPAFIDSLITQLYLPEPAWKTFESAFGITYNATAGYYLVDNPTHDRLVQENKSVKFTLCATSSSTTTIDITLPYQAFDHSLKYPLAGINDTTTALRYFPIQKANTSSQNTFGRVFLQEAYLSVNYDNNSFSLSLAKFPGGIGVSAVCVGCTADSASGSTSSSSLSGGAIAGIVIGVLALIALILGAIFGRRYYQKRKLRKLALELTSRASIGGTTVNETPYNLEPNNNMEYYKPPLPPHDEKAELDAMLAGQRATMFHRHELSGDHDRRMSSHSGITRATFSPKSSHMGAYSPMTSQPSSPPATGPHTNYFELPHHEPKSKGDLEVISELGGSEPKTDHSNTRAFNTSEPTETTPALAGHSDSIPGPSERTT